jgi:hypothetical protein
MRRIGPNSARQASAHRTDFTTAKFSSTPRTVLAALGFARPRILTLVQVLAAFVGLICPGRALAQTQAAPLIDAGSSPALVIAFVGGFVHPDDKRHSEVQIVRELRSAYGNRVEVEIFRNRERTRAHKLILGWWNGERAGTVAGEEKQHAPLILFGHSWGASAVVALARELEQDHIPVSLTIQVDSVRRHGHNDSVIPANVAEAMNFYQPDGVVHGRSRITAEDPSRTAILGNVRFKYRKEPAECRAYPWYDRVFFKEHTAIECDPRVWSQVETLIRNRLPSALTASQSTVALQAR